MDTIVLNGVQEPASLGVKTCGLPYHYLTLSLS